MTTAEDPLDAFSAAADKSLESKGFTVRFTVEEGPDQDPCMPPMSAFFDDAVSSVDLANDRARWPVDGVTFYRDGDAFLIPAAVLPDLWHVATGYVRIDESDDPAAFASIEYSEWTIMSDIGQGAEEDLPSAMLGELRTLATDVRVTGTEEIDGRPTTRYTAILTASQVEDSDDLSAGAYDVWVDGDGLVRRMRMGPLPATDSSTTADMSFDMDTFTIDITDYGETIELPSDVTTLGSLGIEDPEDDLSDAVGNNFLSFGEWTPPKGCEGTAAGMFSPECREWLETTSETAEESFGEIGDSIESVAPPGDADTTLSDEQWAAEREAMRPPDACIEAMGSDPECWHGGFDTTTTLPPSCADDPMFGVIGIECDAVADSEPPTTSTRCGDGLEQAPDPDQSECPDGSTTTGLAECVTAEYELQIPDPDPSEDALGCSLTGAMITGEVSDLPEGCTAAMPKPCRQLTEQSLTELATADDVLPDETYEQLSDCFVALGVIESCIPPNDPDAELSDDCTDLVDDAMTRDFLVDE